MGSSRSRLRAVLTVFIVGMVSLPLAAVPGAAQPTDGANGDAAGVGPVRHEDFARVTSDHGAVVATARSAVGNVTAGLQHAAAGRDGQAELSIQSARVTVLAVSFVGQREGIPSAATAARFGAPLAGLQGAAREAVEGLARTGTALTAQGREDALAQAEAGLAAVRENATAVGAVEAPGGGSLETLPLLSAVEAAEVELAHRANASADRVAAVEAAVEQVQDRQTRSNVTRFLRRMDAGRPDAAQALRSAVASGTDPSAGSVDPGLTALGSVVEGMRRTFQDRAVARLNMTPERPVVGQGVQVIGDIYTGRFLNRLPVEVRFDGALIAEPFARTGLYIASVPSEATVRPGTHTLNVTILGPLGPIQGPERTVLARPFTNLTMSVEPLGDRVRVLATLRVDGRPVPEAEVAIEVPGLGEGLGITNDAGTLELQVPLESLPPQPRPIVFRYTGNATLGPAEEVQGELPAGTRGGSRGPGGPGGTVQGDDRVPVAAGLTVVVLVVVGAYAAGTRPAHRRRTTLDQIRAHATDALGRFGLLPGEDEDGDDFADGDLVAVQESDAHRGRPALGAYRADDASDAARAAPLRLPYGDRPRGEVVEGLTGPRRAVLESYGDLLEVLRDRGFQVEEASHREVAALLRFAGHPRDVVRGITRRYERARFATGGLDEADAEAMAELVARVEAWDVGAEADEEAAETEEGARPSAGADIAQMERADLPARFEELPGGDGDGDGDSDAGRGIGTDAETEGAGEGAGPAEDETDGGSDDGRAAP